MLTENDWVLFNLDLNLHSTTFVLHHKIISFLRHMEKDDTILNQTLPYSQLALLGISRLQADNLPEDIKSSLLNGKVTTLLKVLKVELQASNGSVVTMPVKLQMIKNEKDESVLMAYPVQREISEKTIKDLVLQNKK